MWTAVQRDRTLTLWGGGGKEEGKRWVGGDKREIFANPPSNASPLQDFMCLQGFPNPYLPAPERPVKPQAC